MLVLSLVGAIVTLNHATLDRQVVRACEDLIHYSEISGTSVKLPCSLSEGQLVYGSHSVAVGSTSHGVVVEGEHWSAP